MSVSVASSEPDTRNKTSASAISYARARGSSSSSSRGTCAEYKDATSTAQTGEVTNASTSIVQRDFNKGGFPVDAQALLYCR